MARESINIAVVGLGFGSSFVPIYQKHPSVARVGVCDLNAQLLEETADRFEVEDRFSRLEDILADGGYDAVHLLTPVPAHVENSLAVLEARKHCACAVPMATSLDDLSRIIAAQRRSGKRYMMMETAIYDRAFFFVKNLLDRGELGAVTLLRGDYFQDLEGDYPDYWRAQPPMHYATHALSPLLALAQTRAVSVSCVGSSRLRSDLQQPGGNTFPLQAAHFRLDGSDVIVQLTRSWFQMAREYTEAFSVYGELRTFEWQQIEDEDPVVYTMKSVQPGRRGREVEAVRVPVPFRPDLVPTEIAEFANGWHGGSHPHLAHEFVTSIVEGRSPAIDAVTAANWTAAGICANDSAVNNGVWVDIPAFGP